MKNIVILGSTGSVGCQSIEIAKHLGYNIMALTGHNNIKLLENQCRSLKPKTVCVADKKYNELKILLADTPVVITAGENALCEIAESTACDVLVNSLLGIAGLKPTLAALNGKKIIALANKETLVAGGNHVMKKAKKTKTKIIPVDSEHCAIHQCLQSKSFKKIILTASGGAFYGKKRKFLEKATLEMALNHPNWNMGEKITIDSATLMNKGLELIEAMHLFTCVPSNIEVIIHRESIIHSMVEYYDNSVIAQLANPDMRLCIQYALTYPKKIPGLTKQIDFVSLNKLTFDKPDEETFTLLTLARNSAEIGGNAPAVMNGANEAAVELFLKRKIKFTDIFDIVGNAVSILPYIKNPSLDDIYDSDNAAREFAKTCI